MLDFLIAHYDWIIAGVVGHFSLSGASSIVTLAKTEYAKFSAIAAAVKTSATAVAPAPAATLVAPVTISK